MDALRENMKKTVSFNTNTNFNNENYQYNNNTVGQYPTQNLNLRSSFLNSNQSYSNLNPNYSNVNQINSVNVRPSIVNTTFNQSASQGLFGKNPSIVMLGRNPSGLYGRNPSSVVKPDSLIKIEVYSPENNGTINRIYSARLAYFIKSLNTYRLSNNNNQYVENSFVNGGVWAKSFQNRNSICVVINGNQVVENFPLSIFNEDPRNNFQFEIKQYRSTFINTISQFNGCRFLNNNQN
jgi:hypothetical protein